jgi:hypothetical protein
VNRIDFLWLYSFFIMCMFGTGFWDAGIDTRGVEMIFIYLDVFFFFLGRIDSNLKLWFVVFDSGRDCYTQVYRSTHFYGETYTFYIQLTFN